MTGWEAGGVLVLAAATGTAGLRWLRVAQREHYLAGSVTRFAGRWWWLGPNIMLAFAAVVAVLASHASARPPYAVALAVAVGPFGLSIRGRTSTLAWTRRMRTLAGVWLGLQLLVIAFGLAIGRGPQMAGLGALAVPILVDVALMVTAPLELRLGQKFVESAQRKLSSVRPTVVAITGSFGKTSTKGYIAHLVAGSRTVAATPKSFNNRNGLARAINDHLPPGTEVFVAEMGTYGPGEIRDMCSWVAPGIAVITAIGPVHLERMGSEDRILEAKSEIVEKAGTVILNGGDARLAALARSGKVMGKKVVLVSTTDPDAPVCVRVQPDGLEVMVAGEVIATAVDVDAPASNVACAVAVALELGVPPPEVAARLPGLPVADNRLARTTGAGGFTILDDTYNSNPAGARRALAALGAAAQPGRRAVLVTPGMVELGRRQAEENAAFAVAAAAVASDLVVVGQTNRKALITGAKEARLNVVVVENREKAVDWVRTNLSTGDVVLYENDLPDHYA